jgi:hypothetical protein
MDIRVQKAQDAKNKFELGQMRAVLTSALQEERARVGLISQENLAARLKISEQEKAIQQQNVGIRQQYEQIRAMDEERKFLATTQADPTIQALERQKNKAQDQLDQMPAAKPLTHPFMGQEDWNALRASRQSAVDRLQERIKDRRKYLRDQAGIPEMPSSAPAPAAGGTNTPTRNLIWNPSSGSLTNAP